MIKVVHILDSLGLGGLEKGVVTLANNTSQDIRHTIICLRTSGPSAEKLPSNVDVIAMHKPTGNSFFFLRSLAHEIRRLNPDIVHTRNWGGMDGIIAARMAGIKNIVHGEHGWDLSDPQGSSRKRKLIRRMLSFGACEYVSVSKRIKVWLETEVKVFRPVTQIYNGVDSNLYCPSPEHHDLRLELGLPSSASLIGIVARLDPIKDHATLLYAFAGLTDACPDAHLLIIGEGAEKQKLMEHSGERVHFLGDRNDVADIMRELDIFVLCSLNEGISNTILEAMASGVPVIASHVGGNPELVRDGREGRLFPAGDVTALQGILQQYLDNPEFRSKHGACGRKRVLEQFSIIAMVKQYEQVWRRVAARNQ